MLRTAILAMLLVCFCRSLRIATRTSDWNKFLVNLVACTIFAILARAALLWL